MSRTRSHSQELRVGILLLLAVAVFAWLSVQVGALKTLGNTVTVTAVFDDVAGLVDDAGVRVAGVKVGSVDDLEVDFDRARVTLVLKSEAKIRSDVRAEIRARSLLGEKYVALRPKTDTAPLLQDGDVIEATSSAMDADKIMARFGPLVDKVDPDDVARIVKNLGNITDDLDKEVPKVVTNLDKLVTRLNDIAGLVPETREDVSKLVTDIRRVGWKLERTLAQANKALGSFTTASDKAAPLITKVDSAFDTLSPHLDDLGRSLEQSDELVTRLMKVLAKAESFDEATLRRLLREEGVLVRLKPQRGRKD